MEIIPERGEIWWVSLDPTLGSEIHKTRPDRCATVEFAEAKPADLDSK